jgi:hypothetical protein
MAALMISVVSVCAMVAFVPFSYHLYVCTLTRADIGITPSHHRIGKSPLSIDHAEASSVQRVHASSQGIE